MKNLNVVDVEMNNEVLDETEVLVTLDSGGMSRSSTPPLSFSNADASNKNCDEQNGFSCNSNTSSSDEVDRSPKFPPPPLLHVPVICNIENKGEKEKSSVLYPDVINSQCPGPPASPSSLTDTLNLAQNEKPYIVKSSNNLNCAEDKIVREVFGEKDKHPVRPKAIPSINDFKILKVLGKGAYGKVYQVRKVNGPGSGHIYAMKAMNKSRICGSKTDVRHTKAERDVLVSVNKESNPFIVRLHFAFETERR